MPSKIQGATSANEAIAQRPVETMEQPDLGLPVRERSLLSEVLVSLLRYWKVAATVFVTVLVGSFAYLLFAVPAYTSNGVLQVSSDDGIGAGVPVPGMLLGGGTKVETEVEVIRRRKFVLSAAHALGMTVVDPKQHHRFTTDLSVTLMHQSPVNPKLVQIRDALEYARVPAGRQKGVSGILRVTGPARFEFDFLAGDEVSETQVGIIGQAFSHPQLEMKFERLPFAVGESMQIAVVPDGPLADSLLGGLKVKALGGSVAPTNLVEISFGSTSRTLARDFVQTLMNEYLEQNLKWQAVRASRSADFLGAQIEDIQERLATHEEALREYSEKEKAAGLGEQARVTVEENARLQVEASKLDMKIDVVDTGIKRLQSNLNGKRPAFLTATFFEDQVLLAAVSALTTKETRREVLRASYQDTHPLVVTISKEILEQKRAVLSLLKTARKNLDSQKRELKRASDKVEEVLVAFPDKEMQLARRTRDLEVSHRLYSFLLEKKHEAEILKASTTTDKRIVDPASLPYKRSRPTRIRVVMGGLLLAMLLGVGAAFLVRSLKKRVDSIERIQEMLDLSVYGTIPALEDDKANETTEDGRRALLHPDSIWSDMQTPVTEAIRSLSVNVGMIPKTPGRARVIQITSSESREGKSTVIANLAVALRRSGSSVVIVDLDLRKPTQHRLWSCPRAPGYSDTIAAGCMDHELYARVQVVGKSEVKLLSAGAKVPETLTVLMHPGFTKLLEDYAKNFDYVLVDSPPIFVADTLIIAKYVDLLLVTARPGLVERSNLAMTVHRLGKVSVPKGLVFNAVQRKHCDAQYYGSYYGNYSSYGYAYTGYSNSSYVSEDDHAA